MTYFEGSPNLIPLSAAHLLHTDRYANKTVVRESLPFTLLNNYYVYTIIDVSHIRLKSVKWEAFDTLLGHNSTVTTK